MAEYIGWKPSLTAALGKIGEILAVQQVALTSDLIYTIPEGTPSGIVHRVVFTQDGTGGHTVTYNDLPVTVDTTAGAVTTVELHPAGAGYVVRYPPARTFAERSDLRAVSNVQHSLRRPVVTFVSDDNSPHTVTKLRPLSVTYGIPMCAALITGQQYSAADFLDLQNRLGWEIASHSDTHYYLPATASQIATEHEVSKAKLEAQGLNITGIVYPGGMNDEVVRRTAKRYYRYGISVSHSAGTNSGVIPSFNIKRVGIGAYFDPAVGGLPATNTLEYYKARVDQAVTENSWLVFMLHPGETDATQMGYLEAVIQYVQSLNIDILTARDAFDIFGNAVEAGDYNTSTAGTGLAISKDGQSNNFPNGLQIVSKVGINAASPPSSFPRYAASATSFLYADAAGSYFPTRVGTLVTYRLNADDELTTQVWYDYFADRVFTRRWRAAGWQAWSEFVTLTSLAANESHHMNLTANAYTGAQLANTYPANRVTVHYVDGAGAAGYPGSGICTTYHIGWNGWRRQEFRKYDTDEIWARHTSSVDGAWTPWVLVSGTQAFTTALRPTDKAVGASIFDTTLGKPIWLKTAPSTWVDATGATV